MPTNLAALPSNVPIPNGRVQIKRGVTDNSVNYNTATAAGTALQDGAGGNMQISYTPPYPCFWIVRSNVMAHGYPDGVGYRRWDHMIMITPADADGLTNGFECCEQVYDNSTIEWRTVSGSFAFRLNAGIAYTAYMAHWYLSAGTVQVHQGPQWTRIVGRAVSEGVQ